MGRRISHHRATKIAATNPYFRPITPTSRNTSYARRPIFQDPDDDTVSRMADALRDAYAEQSHATAGDLVRAGFTKAEVEQHGDAAVALARHRFVRRVA